MCRTPSSPASSDTAHRSSPNNNAATMVNNNKEEEEDDVAVATATAAAAASSSMLLSSTTPFDIIDYWLSGMRHCWEVTMAYYRAGQFSWPLIIYMIFVHVAALRGVWAIPSAKPQTALLAFFLVPISGLGITVGAHRLWAHRSYQAHISVRIVLMILNSMANQRSLYHWCKDHRVHHKYSETNADPHDARKGFFFAHIGWLLVRKHPDVGKLGKQMDFSDLLEDPVVRFQEMLDPFFAAYLCYIFPAQLATYFWDESFLNGFLIPGAVRYCFVLHCTFLVNSAAHLFGDHPYDASIHPAENPIVSFFAFGEGWHNWHHKYPWDYATSEFGMISQYNPSKIVIDLLAALGLVWGRKRATKHWAVMRTRRLDKQQQQSSRVAATVATK